MMYDQKGSEAVTVTTASPLTKMLMIVKVMLITNTAEKGDWKKMMSTLAVVVMNHV